MSVVTTVADDSDVTVSAAGKLVHLCPHRDEIDEGRIWITWRVVGRTYELHALAEYLRGFKDSRISHEEVTDQIRHELSLADGVELLSVETAWQTGGMEVRCATAPTLRGGGDLSATSPTHQPQPCVKP